MSTNNRHDFILILALLLAIGVFILDAFVFPGAILPASLYFAPTLMVAYFVSSGTTAVVAGLLRS